MAVRQLEMAGGWEEVLAGSGEGGAVSEDTGGMPVEFKRIDQIQMEESPGEEASALGP